MANFDQAKNGNLVGNGPSAITDIQGVANGLGLLLSGVFVMDVQIEISFDGVVFVSFEALKTAPGHYPIVPCHSVRLTVTNFVSGAANYRLGGLRSVDD